MANQQAIDSSAEQIANLVDKAREEWKKFLAQGWRQTKVVW